ncbi:MAG: hypothetical protein KAI47_18560 [Deltaproteobacteria bacterium]|nr:hypothetical protein [Deltaproteobacteria bacterium]
MAALRYRILRSASVAIIAAALAATSACQGDGEPLLEQDDPMAVGGKADSPTTPPPALAGTYALTVISRTTSREHDSQKLSILETRLTGLTTISQRGRQLTLTLNPCHLALPKAGNTPLTLDDAVMQAMPNLAISAQITTPKNGDSSRLKSAPFAFTLGVDLADPLSDPLPKEAEDPAVVDQDGDNKPGVSVAVGWFEIQLALRLRSLLSASLPGATTATAAENTNDGGVTSNSTSLDDAAVASPDAENEATTGQRQVIRGVLDDPRLEVQIYDDSIPFVDAAKEARDAAASSDIIAQEQTFTLVPVTSTARCEDITQG